MPTMHVCQAVAHTFRNRGQHLKLACYDAMEVTEANRDYCTDLLSHIARIC